MFITYTLQAIQKLDYCTELIWNWTIFHDEVIHLVDIFAKEGFILVQFLVLPGMFTLEFVLGKMDSLTFGE